MALELLFGRSSADHELALLQRVQQVLATDEQAQVFYIVPNHIKFETEINVLTRLATLSGRHGVAIAVPNVSVFSLSRLAWYYMQNDPIYQQANLSQNGLTMLVQTLLQQHKAELKLYGNLLTKQGFIGQFTTQLLELKQSGLSWDDVTDIADKLTNQETLQMKLYDLATIGQSLEDELAQRGQYLSSDLLLALKVYLATEKTDISHHYFFINDYSQMTSPERGLVEALITYAGGVTIALPADDGSASLTESAISENDLFYRPKNLGRQLRDAAVTHKIPVIANTIEAQRKMSSGMLAVEDFWIKYEQQGIIRDSYDADDAIEIWQTHTRYQEVEQMARLIRQEVAAGKHRYRDYLLMTRDLGQYENIMPAVFARYEIPIFMDLDRPMSAHPLVAFLDKLLHLAPAYTMTDVMGLLKTELLIPDGVLLADYREALAETENYVLAKNIAGWQWTDKTPWQYDRQALTSDDEVTRERVASKDAQLAMIHDQISQTVAPFLHHLQQAPTAREMARELYNFITQIGIQKRLINWRDNAIEQGDLWSAQQPEQVWRVFISILDDFVQVFDSEVMTLEVLQDVFTAAFDSAKYTGIPATMDQVHISESGIVQRTGYETVIVFGATNHNLPAVTRIKAILHDGDRAILQPALPDNVFLKETSEQQMAQESLLMYRAMMVADQRLIWTYTTSDGDGSQQPSTYVTRIQKQFQLPLVQFDALPDPMSHYVDDYVGTPTSTIAQIIIAYRQAKQRGTVDGQLSGAWHNLMQQVQKIAPYQLQHLLGSLHYQNEPEKLQPVLVNTLFGHDLKASISRLESYSRNPYEFFLQYGLRLQERQVLQLTPAEKGTLMHAMLEQLFQTLVTKQQVLGALTDDQLRHLEQDILQGLLTSDDPTYDIFNSSSRMRFLTQQLAIQVHETMISMKRGQLLDGGVHTIGVEAGFGLPQSQLKPVEYDMPFGRVKVRGKVDRYDLVETNTGNFLTIVDYKSSKRVFDYSKAYAGLELQLMTYWTAMLMNKDVLPTGEMGGALFWTLQNPWISMNDLTGDTLQQLQSAADKQAIEQGRYRGILRTNDDYISRLESTPDIVAPYAIDRKKDNSFKKSADVVSDDTLATLLQFNEYKIKDIAERILEGTFPLYPFRDGAASTGLMYSPYKPIMMFDAMMGNRYNNLEKLSVSAALEAMSRFIQKHHQEPEEGQK